MIYAPSLSNNYGSSVFPGLFDAIYNCKKANAESGHLVEQIKFQLSIVCYAIQSASSVIKEPLDFQRYVWEQTMLSLVFKMIFVYYILICLGELINVVFGLKANLNVYI